MATCEIGFVVILICENQFVVLFNNNVTRLQFESTAEVNYYFALHIWLQSSFKTFCRKNLCSLFSSNFNMFFYSTSLKVTIAFSKNLVFLNFKFWLGFSKYFYSVYTAKCAAAKLIYLSREKPTLESNGKT